MIGERRGGDRKSKDNQEQSGNVSTLIKVDGHPQLEDNIKTRDVAAQKSGFGSGRNYDKAKLIVEKARRQNNNV